jgi:uncharacterized SAM-binding protein YcdF (DUF218 family)
MIKRRKKHERELVPFERSRRIIRLERRGYRYVPVAAHVFGGLGVVCILYCGGIAVAGFGTYFFLLWGGIGVGSLILSAILRSEKLMEAMPGWFKGICCGIFFAGLLLFCGVEGLILSQYGARAEPGADYLIVLGAQWKSTGPSEVLRRRLDQAAAYLLRNPDTKVIVSGGQGSNEHISEAAGMRDYLVNAGVREDKILMEDKSSNTYENLVFSGGFLDREQDSVVIVTNNFHMFRALSIAKKQGYKDVQGLAANSVLGMGPNNLLREFFGVLKDFWVGNL